MSGWWFGGLLVICFFIVVNTREDIDSAITLAHCRASCIHKVSNFKCSLGTQHEFKNSCVLILSKFWIHLWL